MVIPVAEHLDVVAREPMIVEHSDGTLFVAGYGEPTPTLWKSRDRGVTWSRVNVGSAAEGAIGNSDVDLSVARDGTVYFVTMVFDREAPAGTHISVGASTDVGASWKWTLLSKSRYVDRPWVAAAPDGRAHVVWNDTDGVHHATSNDHGLTWIERARIHTEGSSSHFVVGPNGELAVRITPFSFVNALRIASGSKIDDRVDLIAVSTDAGATWQKRRAPGQREWTREAAIAVPAFAFAAADTPPRWVEPIAWDAHGVLFSLWTNRAELWLARSRDRGETWTKWRVADGGEVRYFPYLVARGDGELAATWFSGRGATLQAHAAVMNAGRRVRTPQFTTSQPFFPDTWMRGRSPSDPPVQATAGEYLAVAFLNQGRVVVVSPIVDARANRFGFCFWSVADVEHSKLH